MKPYPSIQQSTLFLALVFAALWALLFFSGCGGGGGTPSTAPVESPSPSPSPSPTPVPTGTISGKITDGTSPLRNVTVVLDETYSTVTDENGVYTFADIPQGDHTLRVLNFLYEEHVLQISLSSSEHSVPEIPLTRITYPASSRQLQPSLYSDAPNLTHTETVLNSNNAVFAINAAGQKLPRTLMMKIENTGNTLVKNPKLIVNGRGDFSTVDSILTEIIEPGMTDREKALAIWWYVTNNRYHYPPADPNFSDFTPMHLMYIYGYNNCTYISIAIRYLAEQAGLQARTWMLNGHVVPEIYYNGSWHILDGDLEVYYAKNDGELASVEEIENDTSLVTLWHPTNPTLAYIDVIKAIYGSKDNYVYDYPTHDHPVRYTLRPQERLEMYRGNEGVHFYKRFYDSPTTMAESHPAATGYSCAWLTYEPDVTNTGYMTYLDGKDNIASSPSGMVLESAGSGTAVFKVAPPSVILKGILKAKVLAEEPETCVRVSFSMDNKATWIPLWESTVGQAGWQTLDVDFSRYFVTGLNPPCYGYFVRFEITSPNDREAVAIKDLVLDTQIQISTLAQPHLEPGNNSITYSDDSDEPSNVRITYAYQPDCDDLVYRVDSTLPANGDVNVDVAAPIQAVFTEDVAESESDFHSMTVLVNSPAKSVEGAIAYDAGTKTLTFTPDQPLEPNTKYRVFISRRCLLKNLSWRPTDSIGRKYMDYKWTFTTAP